MLAKYRELMERIVFFGKENNHLLKRKLKLKLKKGKILDKI